MKRAESRKLEGLRKPISLVEACEILGDSKNLQDEAEAKLRVLEEAAASSQKMTSHQVISLSLVNTLNTCLSLVSSPHNICLFSIAVGQYSIEILSVGRDEVKSIYLVH